MEQDNMEWSVQEIYGIYREKGFLPLAIMNFCEGEMLLIHNLMEQMRDKDNTTVGDMEHLYDKSLKITELHDLASFDYHTRGLEKSVMN